MADGFRAIDPDKDWKRMRRHATALFDSFGALRDCHIIAQWARKLGEADDPIAQQLFDHLDQQEIELEQKAAGAIDAFDRKQWQSWTQQLGERARRLPVGSHVFQVLALEKLIAARRMEAPALKSGNTIAFHRLRIGVKKFRYVVENFLPDLHQQWKAELDRSRTCWVKSTIWMLFENQFCQCVPLLPQPRCNIGKRFWPLSG